MYPLLVDLGRVPALLVGDGPAAARRLAQLDEAGATRLRIFSATPDAALLAVAGARLERRLPTADEIAATRTKLPQNKYCGDDVAFCLWGSVFGLYVATALAQSWNVHVHRIKSQRITFAKRFDTTGSRREIGFV